MVRIKTFLSRIFNDQLYRNSMFSVFSRTLNAAAGFLFWVIAARLYPVDTVGTAVVLISALSLIMLFSRFGFDITIIRYIANTDKNEALSTGLTITTIGSVVIGIIYILFIEIFRAEYALHLIDNLLFVTIAAFYSIALITGNMFLALRKSQHLFMQTVFITLRLFLLYPFACFGNTGILLSLGICYILSVIYSVVVLHKEIKFNILQADKSFIIRSFKFSIQSYLFNVLTEAPILILPIMVLNFLGQKEVAVYYMAMSVGNLILIVPNSLSFSLLVESSHGQPLKQNIFKVIKSAFMSLIPFAVIIIMWGKNILSLINTEYVDAYYLLIMIVITGFFIIFYMVFNSIQNINMRVDRNIKMSLLRFILLMGTGFCLIPAYDIEGVGYAWLLTHVIITFIISGSFIKEVIKK